MNSIKKFPKPAISHFYERSISLTDHNRIAETLAFFTLFIFSRTLDIKHIGLCLHSVSENQNNKRYAQLKLEDSHVLTEAFNALSVQDSLESDCYELDFSIGLYHPEQSSYLQDTNKRITLGYEVLPSNEIKIYLQSTNLLPSEISGNDFLEKIDILISQLRSNSNGVVSELSLLTDTGRLIIADPSLSIQGNSYELTPKVFLRVAELYSNQPAISDGKHTYDYLALKNAALYLADKLIKAGLVEGDTVLVSGVSSFGTIAGFLAAILSGGILVSLDPTLPEDRKKQIVDLSEAKFAILASNIQNDSHQTMAYLPDNYFTIPEWPDKNTLSQLSTSNTLNVTLSNDASAYIFFTSGSTGTPKGVLGAHLGLAHFLDWQRTEYPLGPGDRSAQITSLSFDVVLRDIFYPLTSGACIHIPERSLIFDAQKILRWMSNHKVTIIHSVPSLMKAWLQSEIVGKPFESLKYIFFAGEPLTDELLKRFKSIANPEVIITNLYGPTETTLAKLYNRLSEIEPGIQPIGKPQPGVDVLILRDRKILCGLGEIGEIAIRTHYRSKGYFKNPALTSEVFIKNPWRDDFHDHIYCTGDLGKYREDGMIQIFGRIDGQIKIRGVRIEPNEIEAHILKYPGITNVAVTARLGESQEKTLYAFVELANPIDPAEVQAFNREMRAFLKISLPDVMIPKRMIPIEKIPHLPNGKVNRKVLGTLDVGQEALSVDTPLVIDDDNTRHIVEGFEKTLGFKIHNINETFIDLGGDSLSFIRASLVVEKAIGWLPESWESISINELSKLEKKQSQLYIKLPLPILFRAISIIFVVLNHIGQSLVASTGVLFVVAGLSFGKFQMQSILQRASIRPIFPMIFKIAIPTIAFTIFRGVVEHDLNIYNILLVGTFLPASVNAGKNYWFIDMLIASLFALAFIFSVNLIRTYMKQRSFLTLYILTFVVMIINVMQLKLNLLGSYQSGLFPLSYLWLMFLGISMNYASTIQKKVSITMLLLTYLVISENVLNYHDTKFEMYFIVSVLALIYINNIFIPKFIAPLVMSIASCSLFIYILNIPVHNLLSKFTNGLNYNIELSLILLFGYVAYVSWEYITSMFLKLYDKLSVWKNGA